MFGTEPVITAVHAGLECGVFAEKMPDIDIISIGVNILGEHSTEERMSISSFYKVLNFLVKVLEEL